MMGGWLWAQLVVEMVHFLNAGLNEGKLKGGGIWKGLADHGKVCLFTRARMHPNYIFTAASGRSIKGLVLRWEEMVGS